MLLRQCVNDHVSVILGVLQMCVWLFKPPRGLGLVPCLGFCCDSTYCSFFSVLLSNTFCIFTMAPHSHGNPLPKPLEMAWLSIKTTRWPVRSLQMELRGPYKWPKKWVIGGYNPRSGVMTYNLSLDL